MTPSAADTDLSRIVGHAPSIAGALARRAADSAPVRRAAEVPAVVRRGVESPVVRNVVQSGVDAVRHDARTGVAVARDIVTTAPRDAVRVSRTGVAVARATRPVVRSVSDRVFAGVPTTGQLAEMGATAVANWAAQVMTGQFINGSAWKRFAKYRMSFEA